MFYCLKFEFRLKENKMVAELRDFKLRVILLLYLQSAKIHTEPTDFASQVVNVVQGKVSLKRAEGLRYFYYISQTGGVDYLIHKGPELSFICHQEG